MNDYYKREFERINPPTATIELKDESGGKTKTLGLNQESAKELIDWLSYNFCKLKK